MEARFRINIDPASSPSIELIRRIRTITGVSLAAAKDLAEQGGTVKVTTDPSEADEIKGQLEGTGARVEVVEEGTGGRSERRFRVQLITVGEDPSATAEAISRLTGMDSAAAQDVVDRLGVVDEDLEREAAERMAGELALVGAQVMLLPMGAFSLNSGEPLRVQVIGEQNRPVVNVTVRLETSNPAFNDTVGAVTTDAEGFAEFDDLSDEVNNAFDELPAIRFAVEGAERTYRIVNNGFTWLEYEEFPETTFTLIVKQVTQPEPGPGEPEPDKDAFSVHGTVMLPGDEAAAGLTVRAFDRDLRSQELLGEATTDDEGRYAITYTREQFRRAEKERADLVLRVYNAVGTELEAESDRGEATLFNARPDEEVNLQIQTSAVRLIRPSEYEREVQALEPALDGVPLAALTEDDARFLHHDAGIEREHIRFIAQDARLAQETGLPEAISYGLARQGVGLVEEEPGPRLDLDRLLEHPTTELIDGIEGAVDAEQIPLGLRDQFDFIQERFRALRAERGLLPEHRLEGQLVDAEADTPLSGYTVLAYEAGVDEEVGLLAAEETDAQGRFELSYTGAEGGSSTDGTDRPLRLEVVSADGEEVHRQDVPAGQASPLAIRVELPAAPEPVVPGDDIGLRDLNGEVGLDLPDELLDALAGRGIQTPADIRRQGGLSHLEDLPATGDGVVSKLEAFANLSMLSLEHETTAKLVNNGYAHPADIASSSPGSFIETNAEVLGKQKAAVVYATATGVTNYLNSVSTGYILERDRVGEDIKDIFTDAAEVDLPEQKCACDCNHALSPSAYLAELLDYVTNHLTHDGRQKVTLEDLARTFHQPFDRMPVACKYAKEEVRQVRIVVEVLRSYLTQNPPPTPEQQRHLDEADKAYRLTAYQTLLRNLGTSYEEVREARTDTETRQQLADRLGIQAVHLDGTGDDLFVAPNDLTEEKLQQLFGYQVTTDPLADLGEPHLLAWQKDRLDARWRKEDSFIENAPGRLVIDPDLVGEEDIGEVPWPTLNPALRLLRERRQTVDGWLSAAQARPKSQVGLEGLIQDDLGIRDFSDQVERARQGSDVSEFLESFGLTRGDLLYLDQTLETLRAGNSLTGAEWDDIYAIAVQSRKQRKLQQQEWKVEEVRQEVALTPRQFRLRRRDISERLEAEPHLRLRVSPLRRRDWERTLEARIAQLNKP